MKTELANIYDGFAEAVTGDLKWVIIALIALTGLAIYLSAIFQVEAEIAVYEDEEAQK